MGENGNFSFDVSGLMSEEEALKYFEENAESEAQEKEPIDNNEDNPAEESADSPEKVGVEETKGKQAESAAEQQGGGSSPNVLSSIASALKNDGIFSAELSDEDIDAVKTPEDFAEIFEKEIEARMSESQRRIDKALRNGMEPDEVRNFEQALNYLSSITDEVLNAEGDEGEGLRSRLIYNDLVRRGFSHEKALKEVEKSFKSGSDLEDAKDALSALSQFYSESYEKKQKEAENAAKEAKEQQKKDAEKFKKMILEDELKIGDSSLDKRTRQQVYDAVMKPVYKDPDTGNLLTLVQKFNKENPMEFLKQIGLWYVLTSGGKNIDGLVKGQVKSEKNKGIRELERKINTTQFGADGSLKLMSGGQIEEDSLLLDGWNVIKNIQ